MDETQIPTGFNEFFDDGGSRTILFAYTRVLAQLTKIATAKYGIKPQNKTNNGEPGASLPYVLPKLLYVGHLTKEEFAIMKAQTLAVLDAMEKEYEPGK